MKFNPWKCPNCTAPARGTVDNVPGIALLDFEDDGTAEYRGETKMCWDGQTVEEDEQGRQMLICPKGA